MKLNCWVLGQESKRIFAVEIPQTKKTASYLRKLIKDENPVIFHDIQANELDLYKVRVLFDENLEDLLRALTSTFREHPFLNPWATISSLFPTSESEPGEWLIIVDPGRNLLLNCLIFGTHISQAFSIRITGTATVYELKVLIKQEKPNKFHNIDIDDLELHEVSLPVDKEIDKKLRRLTLNVPLFFNTVLWTRFAQTARENIHILIKPHGNSTTLLQVGEQDDALTTLTESFERTITLSQNFTPSKAAKSSEYVKIQSGDQRILDCRCAAAEPANTVAPPIQLFSPAFAHFSSKAFDPEYNVPDDFVRNVWVLMNQFALIHTSEEDRRHHLTTFLTKAIGRPLELITNYDKTAPDFVALSSCEELSVYLVIGEEKNEFDDGGSDPSVQAAFSFLHIFNQKKNEGLLTRCCCPTFIVAHAGPWLTIMGGIITAKCIVQRLTDFLWVPVHSTHDDDQCHRIARVFYALKESIEYLDLLYKNIKAITPLGSSARHIHPRFFPSPDTYHYKNTLVRFTYRAPLEQHDSCVTYVASTIEDSPKDIVVKFVTSYGENVHKKMASLGFAPELLYCGPIKVTDDMPSYGKLRMVVMKYVEGLTLEVALKKGKVPSRFQRDLCQAFKELHDAGYVFGDLREPNVMVTSDLEGTSTAQLIDFNWAAKADEAKYPVSISNSINWPAGVQGLMPIQKEHDLFMLESLRSRCPRESQPADPKGKKRAPDTPPSSGQSPSKKSAADMGFMDIDDM